MTFIKYLLVWLKLEPIKSTNRSTRSDKHKPPTSRSHAQTNLLTSRLNLNQPLLIELLNGLSLYNIKTITLTKKLEQQK